MFKDERRYDVWERIRQQDLRAFARLLPQSLFRQAAEQSEVAGVEAESSERSPQPPLHYCETLSRPATTPTSAAGCNVIR